MRHRGFHHLLPAFLALLTAACALGGQAAESDQALFVTVESKALAGNLLGIPTTQRIAVCLPPSYARSTARYPVIYYYHGYGESMDPSRFWSILADLMRAGRARECIMVGVPGYTSFYVNSPVTGGWEDFTVREVVEYVDRNYRTIPSSPARGLLGFSMGGFAALNLAFRHPDVFGSTFAVAPGLLAPGGLTDAMMTWDRSFQQAYGAAFAPDPETAPYARIPKFDGSTSDGEIIKAWESGFGDLEKKVQDYLAKDTPLRGIRIQCGVSDMYWWIPEGCVYLSQLLWKKKIPHELALTTDHHTLSLSVVERDIAPFFLKHLARE